MKEHQITALLHKVIAENSSFTTWTVSTPHLVALVNHAVEKEREECAKFCEEQYEFYGYDHVFAAGIRARGQNE